MLDVRFGLRLDAKYFLNGIILDPGPLLRATVGPYIQASHQCFEQACFYVLTLKVAAYYKYDRESVLLVDICELHLFAGVEFHHALLQIRLHHFVGNGPNVEVNLNSESVGGNTLSWSPI